MNEQTESRKIDTGTDDLLARVESQVAILTMNRPERRNALSGAMLAAMRATLLDVERDPEVRCVVLTGAGGAFCAGGDVKGMAEAQSSGGRRRTLDEAIHLQRLDQRGTAGKLYEMPKPTVAMLPGAAAGDLEATHHVHTALTEDHRNAVRAFVEKRAPEFKGR